MNENKNIDFYQMAAESIVFNIEKKEKLKKKNERLTKANKRLRLENKQLKEKENKIIDLIKSECIRTDFNDKILKILDGVDDEN